MGRVFTAQIVCWHCKKSGVTLHAIPAEDGTKERSELRDYVCTECLLQFPRPPIGNCSKVYLPKPPVKDEPEEKVREWKDPALSVVNP